MQIDLEIENTENVIEMCEAIGLTGTAKAMKILLKALRLSETRVVDVHPASTTEIISQN